MPDMGDSHNVYVHTVYKQVYLDLKWLWVHAGMYCVVIAGCSYLKFTLVYVKPQLHWCVWDFWLSICVCAREKEGREKGKVSVKIINANMFVHTPLCF